MGIDQVINSAYQKNLNNVGSQYKLFYNEEQEGEDGNLLEPTAADPIAAPTAQAPDPKAPQAPTAPDPKAPPAEPQDTVATTPPSGGGAGEEEVVKAMAGILEGGGGNMKLDKMVEELKGKGFEARISDTGSKGGSGFQRGTIEIIASDGTKVAFKDEDGDSAIGMVDQQFREKVQQYCPDQYDSLVQKSNAQKANAGEGDKSIKADGTSAVDSKSSAAKDGFVGGAQDGSGAAAPTDAPADAKASVADPVAAIGDKISSGDTQTNAKGESYKYQVKDTNLNSCPRGKPACTGCGQCMKAEIFKAQKGEAAAPAEQAAAAEEVPEAVQAAPQAPQAQSMEIPQAANYAKKDAAKPEVNQDDVKQTLKLVQEYLDSMGFGDKSAEDLLADGQLGQVALQLGINVPEHIA
jgi:hypothetical protein